MNAGTGNANPLSAMRPPPPRADGFALRHRHAVSGARVIVAFGAASGAPLIMTPSAAARCSLGGSLTRRRAVQSP